jgi:uncharacterized protein YfkK (UPF0435 family)
VVGSGLHAAERYRLLPTLFINQKIKNNIMKTFKLNIRKIGATLLIGMLLSVDGISQTHVTMSMKNITTTPNTIEYDLYIVNDGSTDFKLSACSYGVNFNPDIVNGGVLNYDYVDNSKSEELTGLTPFSKNVKEVDRINQVRIITTPCGYENAPELKPEVPFKVGRFSIVNSADWTPNSRADFRFQEALKIGLTTTQVVGYADNQRRLIALTPGLNTVSTLIEQAPVLNPGSGQQAATQYASNPVDDGRQALPASSTQHKLYPNPVLNELNLDLIMIKVAGIQINICDLHGRRLKQIKTSVIEGKNRINLDVADLVPGNYTVSVKEEGYVHYSDKFIKH